MFTYVIYQFIFLTSNLIHIDIDEYAQTPISPAMIKSWLIMFIPT